MKWIRTLLAVTVLATFSLRAQADPISVNALMEKYNSTDDSTYLTIALQRCSAIYMILSRDVPELEDQGIKLFSAGFRVFEQKQLSRDTESGRDTYMERYSKSTTEYAEMYGKRMADNQANTGDQIAQDSWLVSDVNTCKLILSMLNKQVGE